jgi:hypothetical protein
MSFCQMSHIVQRALQLRVTATIALRGSGKDIREASGPAARAWGEAGGRPTPSAFVPLYQAAGPAAGSLDEGPGKPTMNDVSFHPETLIEDSAAVMPYPTRSPVGIDRVSAEA